MNNIIDLEKEIDKRTDWETSKVICEHCVFPFVSVHPLLDEVECPSCGKITKIEHSIFELFFKFLTNISENDIT